MSSSICKFMPVKDYCWSIKPVNFVFESEFRKLKQPFFKPIYVMHIVTKGKAELAIGEKRFTLEKGCLFIAFPGKFYEIGADGDFEYAYISFMGAGVAEIFEKFCIEETAPVKYGFSHLIDFWLAALSRIQPLNANVLTESVLLYTFSYLGAGDKTVFSNKENTFESIVDYIDRHYAEADMNLRKVAGIFSYTQKYLSSLFKKKMNVGFCKYVITLRIQYAQQLIGSGLSEVSALSEACGFGDAMYFSKVFKKKMGMTPTDYIKLKNAEKKQKGSESPRENL